jgi:pimeloyl-ACP methyl ester carboxylesterase
MSEVVGRASMAADVRRFRDVLLGCLDGHNGRSADELVRSGRHAYLVYLLPESLLAAPRPIDGKDMLDVLDDAYAWAEPGDLYRRALEARPSPISRKQTEDLLSRVPITVIVFPGIFGEFVTVSPFDEVARSDTSAYAREWQHLLERYRETHSKSDQERTLWDEGFSLAALRLDSVAQPKVRRRLEDLFAVASIDDDNGQPMVRFVVFRHSPDSLETVGALADITPMLSARLAKFFAVAGVPEHVVLLGYSMGACVALDIAATAHARQAAWVKHLRAVITVGGVIHGSHLADAARVPSGGAEASLYRQVRLLQQLTAALEETAPFRLLSVGGPSKLGVWWQNLWLGWRFRRDIAVLIADSLSSADPLSPQTLVRLLRRSDFSPSLAMVLGIATRTLRLFTFSDYSLNIRKFKKLVASVLAGVDNLTSQRRRDWWRSHVLPTRGVRYYAIAGTMPGDAADATGNPLIENLEAYAFPSLDLTFLKKSYEDYVHVSRQALNDSQISVARAQFWPDSLPQINPHYRNHPLDARFLGVVGEHHWGMALPEVNHLKGDLKNPFPRAALLEAIAAQVAYDITGAT